MEMFESSNTKILLIVVLVLLFALAYFYSQQYTQESMKNVTNATNTVKPIEAFKNHIPDGIEEEVIGSKVTYPTEKNPFMNVLLDEIKYNPTRAPAASIQEPSINVTLDDFFRTQFVDDPTDVFGKTQSQRQFYTTPSTTVPNDQESYQNWLYKIPGKTCKEGGREACLGGTDGGALPWLNQNP